MSTTIYQIDPLHDSRWPEFVDRHPHASVFHSSEWLQSLRKTYGYRALVFTPDPPGVPLTSGIVACQVDSWLTGRRLVSLPFSDHCEPLVDNAKDLQSLLIELKSRQSGRWKYVEIRPRSIWGSDEENHTGFGGAGQYFLHTLDLRPALEDLYRALHYSVRRNIRRAEREGLIYEEGRSERLLNKFYRLLLMTRRRHQLPPQPMSWFRNLISCLDERLKFRMASKDGQPVASIVTLRYKQTLVYKYGCSDARFHSLGGVSLLFWRAIQEAKQEGLEEFDLGRSDSDQTGLITFKDHWGSSRSTLTYFRYPRTDLHLARESRRMRFAKRVLGHFPDGILAVTGRLFYKHMG